jgi:hypothetical protein
MEHAGQAKAWTTYGGVCSPAFRLQFHRAGWLHHILDW